MTIGYRCFFGIMASCMALWGQAPPSGAPLKDIIGDANVFSGLWPPLVFAAFVTGIFKFMIDQMRKDNDRRDELNRAALVEFRTAMTETNVEFRDALKETNESSVKQMKDISDRDREQTERTFERIYAVTQNAISEMTDLKATMRSLQDEVREGRRGSSLPPPGADDPRARTR